MTAFPPTTASPNGNLHSSSKLKPRSGKKRSKTAKKKTTDKINPVENGNPNGNHADKKPRAKISAMVFDYANCCLNVSPHMMKIGFELLDEATKEEMAERWEKLEAAEHKLFVEKAELLAKLMRSILEANQNSFSTH